MRSRPNVLLGAMLVVATFGCGKGTVDTGDSCVPECGGRECGTDGCGGTCGPCDGGMACNDAGRCMAGHLLTVSKAGTGNGTVKGGAIDCGPICSANLAEGASVTLVAMPSTGSSFSSWSGCDSATGRSCTVTMNRARTVTATFSTGAQDGYTLMVWKTGDGIGTVNGSGIDCGAICSASFAAGTNVTLTAVGLNTSILTSWDGCDWSNDTTCMVAMNRARTVTATFSPIEPAVHTLRVERIGDGSGTVTGPGIDCGAICSASFTDGTDVVLTATASAGSVLASWHGCDWTDDEDCTVSMIGARTVTAAFSTVSQDNHTLRVEKIGDGSGTVTGPGIDCGAICSASFADGTDVVLTATASADSFFAGWSDCDSTNGSRCMVTMNNAKMVFAVFLTIEPGGYALIVEKAGDGSGMVSGPWIECGPCCSAGILGGTDVTLTASASDGSTFVSWDGCDWTDGASCTVTMNGARTVTATFLATWPASYALTVQKTGDGSGTVSGSGIDCGSICTASFTDGTDVTLFANASAGSTFASWSGCDSTSGTTCAVTMNGARAVTATFSTVAPNTYTLTVQKTGGGSGTVTGSGIDCGSTCSASFTDGTNVTLTAASSGSTFASWSGCDSANGTTCTVTMNSAKTVTARFDAYACTPGTTRCVAGDPGLVETCNGTSWSPGECAVRQACAERSCRYVCDLSATAPTGAWACIFPIKDGVNNDLWIQQGNGLTLGQSNNLTASFGQFSTFRDTSLAWPAYLTITSSSSIGFNFKLNGISPGKVQAISWVGRRSGVLTGSPNHYLVGVFNGTTVVANCSTQTVSYSWQSGDCTWSGANMNYSGGWNAMLVSITGDGFGGPIDILELNWLRLSIR